MTVDEYFAVSTEGDRTELIGGELVVNEPMPKHGVIQTRLISRLQVWSEGAEGRGLVVTPADVILGEHDLYAPDLLWIAERNRPADLSQRLARVPDLCVEVRSPGTWRHDVGRKKAVYESGGLPELWLVDDLAETVLVFRRSSADQTSFDMSLELSSEEKLASPQLPGFSLSVAKLFETRFQRPPPS